MFGCAVVVCVLLILFSWCLFECLFERLFVLRVSCVALLSWWLCCLCDVGFGCFVIVFVIALRMIVVLFVCFCTCYCFFCLRVFVRVLLVFG